MFIDSLEEIERTCSGSSVFLLTGLVFWILTKISFESIRFSMFGIFVDVGEVDDGKLEVDDDNAEVDDDNAEVDDDTAEVDDDNACFIRQRTL